MYSPVSLILFYISAQTPTIVGTLLTSGSPPLPTSTSTSSVTSSSVQVIAGVTVPVGLLLLGVLVVLGIVVAVLVWRRLTSKSYDKQFAHMELAESSKGDEHS